MLVLVGGHLDGADEAARIMGVEAFTLPSIFIQPLHQAFGRQAFKLFAQGGIGWYAAERIAAQDAFDSLEQVLAEAETALAEQEETVEKAPD